MEFLQNSPPSHYGDNKVICEAAARRKEKIQSLIFIPHWVCTYFLIRNQTGLCRSLGAAAWIQQAIYAIESKNLKIRPAYEHQTYR